MTNTSVSISIRGLVTVLLISFIVGCNTQPTDSKTAKNLGDVAIANSEEQTVQYFLPTPSDILTVMITSGVDYKDNLIAPTGIETRVVQFKHQALVMGVYFTDFAYLNVFNKRDLSLDYFTSMQSLGSAMGISPLLYDSYFMRAEKNMNNIDSIDHIFSDFAQNAFRTIDETGSKETLSLIAAGSAIETMYIGFNGISNVYDDKEFIANIKDQRPLFDIYYANFIQYYKDEEAYSELVADLTQLSLFFDENVKGSGAATVTKSDDGHFTITDPENPLLDIQKLDELKELVKKIRTKIVELKY
ncbi:MAG: hypothetical protein JW783_16370 [Bacteroidales bacterium]|nr:hypothetical protein [Bacteroidales bacterium]MBN2750715.1 hypothetical protein [Bacteroidales bacterium]